MLRQLTKGYALMLVSLIEVATPLVRMVAFSHILTLLELGFVSALTATIGLFEQITDFAVYRFVFSAPREEFDDALAAAHGLAILRGLVVGSAAALAAPIFAKSFGLENQFMAFVLLGPIIAFRGFEHLAPRVAERDYSYGAQLKTSLCANGVSLAVLCVSLYYTRTHVAFLIAFYAQVLTQVTASHIFAGVKYRVAFFTPHFTKAFRFGYPLIFNGIGLAASNQGDRFLIGGMLGLPALAIYAVVTLATIVPLALLSRVIGTVMLAQLYNSTGSTDGSYVARLRLSSRLLPLVAAFYALGVITLLNVVVPVVFGPQFILPPVATALFGLSLFLRQARGEPFSAMLLNEGRTKRLAIANLSSSSSLAFEFVLLLIFRNFEAVMAGRLIGEIIATGVTLYLTRHLFKPARADFIKASALGLAVLLAAVALSQAGVGKFFVPSIAIVFAGLVVFALWAMSFLPAMLDAGFPAIRQKA